MPTPPAPLAQPGDLVAGKYRVERVMAIGGMGVVLAARHEDLDQPVAIKLLRQEALTNAEAVARFLREARTAAKLQGEHIARVFDVGTTDEGIPFMVMEFLSGQDLQQVLQQKGPQPVRDVVDYMLQTLEAVAEAHAAGVIHRDLKPSNLFLASRPDGSRTIKVLDFGISRGQGLDAPHEAGQQPLTATQQVMGSPGYMSPEQMTRPRGVDARTDIWSIGVALYALLTGEQPFQGETVAAVMASILHEPPPKVRAKRGEVPAGLERVIERCLQRDLGARFANVGQLARALEPFGSSWAKLSVERVESSLGAASPAGQTLLRMAEVRPDDSGALPSAAWAGTTSGGPSRRKVLVALGAAGALAAAVGLGVWLGAAGRGEVAPQDRGAAAGPPAATATEAAPATATASATASATAPATATASATATATAPATVTVTAPASATATATAPATGTARPGGTAKKPPTAGTSILNDPLLQDRK